MYALVQKCKNWRLVGSSCDRKTWSGVVILQERGKETGSDRERDREGRL